MWYCAESFRVLSGGAGGDVTLPNRVVCPDNDVCSMHHPPGERRSFRSQIRAIVVTEFKNRRLQGAHDWASAYFAQIPKLRAIVLMYIYSRNADNRGLFEAAAVLYRRRAQDGEGFYIADAVSFGTKPLGESARLFLVFYAYK